MNGQAARGAVVVDTMAASALINSRRRPGEANPFEKLIAGRRVVVSFATVTELRYGATNGKWGELRRRTLEQNLQNPLDQKVHEADRWIVATAIAGALDLLSDDKVFQSVPGLPLLSTRTA